MASRNGHSCTQHATDIDGLHVCTQCGKVLDVSYAGLDVPIYREDTTEQKSVRNPRDHIHEELYNACCNACIPVVYANEAFQKFTELTKNRLEGIRQEQSKRDLAVAALVYVLRKNSVYWTMNELSSYIFFTPKMIEMYHKWFDDPQLPWLPSDLTFRFCGKLMFPRRITMEIYRMTKQFESQNNHAYKPETIAVSMIVIYLLNNDGVCTTHHGSDYKWTSMTQICKSLGISCNTIRRFLKKHYVPKSRTT